MDINQSALSGYQPDNTRRTGIDSARISEASPTKDTSSPAARNTKAQELKEGQTVKAQVLDIRYNEVKVQLEPGKQVVTARLSGDVPLSIGQDAHFTVTEEGPDHLVLKYQPVETTNPNEVTIQKALTASGLPMTDRNRALVSELLNNRMPVDKQTLQTLIRYAVTNREASPLTLVLMHKNNLPMTPANIRQFEAYQNGTHQMLNDIRSITQNITELIRHEPSLQVQTSSLPHQTTDSILQNSVPQLAAPGPQLLASGQTVSGDLPLSDTPLQNAMTMNRELIDLLYNKPSESSTIPTQLPVITPAGKDILLQLAAEVERKIIGNPSLSAQIPSDIIKQLGEGTLSASDTLQLLKGLSTTMSDNGIPELLKQFALSQDTPFLASVLNPAERSNLAAALSGLPQLQMLKDGLEGGNVTMKEALTLIRENLPSLDAGSVLKLLQAPEYAKLLQEAFLQKWTITPEKAAHKDPIANLYQQLKQDLEQLNQLVKADKTSAEPSQLEAPVKNLQDNLQFMKDLNDVFTYLQLPVQFKDRTAHADLYVMSRKKALGDSKENLSVLLHLDMAHLGSVGVHIRMNTGSRIQADFYMDNKEAGRLVKENLPSLAEALEKKGYTLQYEVKDTYKKPDFSKDFIEQSSHDHNISRYTFDIRT